MNRIRRSEFALFAYGFRPFFLAALTYAFVSVGLWIAIRSSPLIPGAGMPPQLWHAHEMLFGFIGAAIAGFLLTAVPSWTGARGFAGAPLIALTLLWLAGRVAFVLAGPVPPEALAFAELAFLPGLVVLIAPPLLRARSRNTPLLGVIVVLWLLDAAFLFSLAHDRIDLARLSLLVGIDVVLLLITVIGGRIVPAFTTSALRREGEPPPLRSRKWVDVAAVVLMLAMIGADASDPGGTTAAAVAGAASLIHAVRLAGWSSRRIWSRPIVWVLHVAYAGLPLGLAMKAIFLTTGWDAASQWLHALTIGAASMMIVAVVTRAALGHTGRTLKVSRTVAIAYGVLASAALVRILAVPFNSEREWVLRGSAVLWMLAFALLLWVYVPILLRPRVDGRPG